jgi:hypothetical protein
MISVKKDIRDIFRYFVATSFVVGQVINSIWRLAHGHLMVILWFPTDIMAHTRTQCSAVGIYQDNLVEC